jgi:hypothetical protein
LDSLDADASVEMAASPLEGELAFVNLASMLRLNLLTYR